MLSSPSTGHSIMSRRYFTACLALLIALLSACGGGGGSGSSGNALNVSAYSANSPYAEVIPDCVSIEQASQSCPLSTLPLLVEQAEAPTVDDIMQRVVVSHDWMGQRFREVLEIMPQELLQLFTAVTAVVIDDDIRPAYYSHYTGAIYIDPAYLWLTNAEKATINKAPDYRSDFGDELNFLSVFRYVLGNQRAWQYYNLEGDQERTIFDIHLNFARLMLHELLHANDFIPPTQAPYLDQTLSAYQSIEAMKPERISRALSTQYPLTSTTLYGLADVMFNGQQATPEQISIDAAEVGAALEADAANDDYAYATPAEDAAMLFEEAMMKYLFSVSRDVAYTNNPEELNYCTQLIVGWGMRDRIGDTDVKARAQFVVSEIYPGRDFSLFFQNLSPPQYLREGDNWCANLTL